MFSQLLFGIDLIYNLLTAGSILWDLVQGKMSRHIIMAKRIQGSPNYTPGADSAERELIRSEDAMIR